MPLGYDLESRVINVGDTADLRATLYGADDRPRPATQLQTVSFVVQAPDGTETTVTGTIDGDGSGYAMFQATTQVGHYNAVARFTDTDGRTKSVRCDFEVRNAFDGEQTDSDYSASYVVATKVWAKIEDCFDAEEAGPWLQDMTLNVFNKEKMESFIDMALFDINYLNPPTSLNLNTFITKQADGTLQAQPSFSLLVQGAFLVCIRHLMTSYVEQPAPTGAQIAWQDRRDYLARWKEIYDIEFAVYDRMAKLYKRQYLGLGRTAALLGSKAGRLVPAPMRTRMIGRGYW